MVVKKFIQKGLGMGTLKVFFAVLLSVVFSPLLVCGADEPSPVVKDIRVVRSGEKLGVEITSDQNIDYSCTKILQLQKIIVDLPRTEPGRSDTKFKVPSTIISTIHLAKKTINDVPVTRITINLSEDADFTDVIDPKNKNKLTIYLRKPPSAQPATPTAVNPKPIVRKQETSLGMQSAELVSVTGVSFNANAILIQTDAAVPVFNAFTKREPGRLVIEIPKARSEIKSITVPENRFGIEVGQIDMSEGILKLVFYVGKKPFPAFHIEKNSSGLRVIYSHEK